MACSCVDDTECMRRDVALILDSSRPISHSDWSKLTSFTARLVTDLRRRDVVSRVAAVTYAYHARVALSLADRDPNHVTSLLTSLPLMWQDGRNVADALRLTRTSVSIRLNSKPMFSMKISITVFHTCVRSLKPQNNNHNQLLFRFNSVLLHNSFELDDRSEH